MNPILVAAILILLVLVLILIVFVLVLVVLILIVLVLIVLVLIVLILVVTVVLILIVLHHCYSLSVFGMTTSVCAKQSVLIRPLRRKLQLQMLQHAKQQRNQKAHSNRRQN